MGRIPRLRLERWSWRLPRCDPVGTGGWHNVRAQQIPLPALPGSGLNYFKPSWNGPGRRDFVPCQASRLATEPKRQQPRSASTLETQAMLWFDPLTNRTDSRSSFGRAGSVPILHIAKVTVVCLYVRYFETGRNRIHARPARFRPRASSGEGIPYH